MNLHKVMASAKRVLLQLKHDPRSIALIIIAPCLLMTILKFVYWSEPQDFQKVAGALLGVFPMLVMFLITSVATLRERTSGTLERILISPVTKFEFIMGYAIAFGIASALQAVFVTSYVIGPLGLKIQGSQAALVGIAILDALLGLALGLFVSSFAKTEFQAIQFLPVILLPQLLLSGLLTPRNSMPRILESISSFLPLSYAVDATKKTLIGQGSIALDIFTIFFFLVFLLGAGSLTLRRTTR